MTNVASTIELLVALIFGAVLFAAGLLFTPRAGFAPVQATQSLVHDLERARFEARTRSACSGVIVDRSGDSYLVFADVDGNCSYEPATDLTLGGSEPGFAQDVHLSPSGGRMFVYDATGEPIGPALERTIVVAGDEQTLLVCIDLNGRPRAQERSC